MELSPGLEQTTLRPGMVNRRSTPSSSCLAGLGSRQPQVQGCERRGVPASSSARADPASSSFHSSSRALAMCAVEGTVLPIRKGHPLRGEGPQMAMRILIIKGNGYQALATPSTSLNTKYSFTPPSRHPP